MTVINWSDSDIDEFRCSGTDSISVTCVDLFYMLYGLEMLRTAQTPNLSTSERDQYEAELDDLIGRINAANPT